MSRDYHTRLAEDVADSFDRYIEDHDITASAGGRRAIKRLLKDEGYLRDENRELPTDGGENTTVRTLEITVAVLMASGLLFAVSSLLALGTSGLAPFSLHIFALGAIAVAVGFLLNLTLHTDYPELLDARVETATARWRSNDEAA